ncbi:MAG: class I SAM-dependent methyltransferase [Desulfosporosinus sp.]|nr:class I SAM-dependent methyltransferase [Desulfosporosinus sp.]
MDKTVIEFSTSVDELLKSSNQLIALQIKQMMNITRGKCLDVSSDGGQLGIAVAKITDLDVYLYETSELASDRANKRINKQRLGQRVFILPSDAFRIPIENESVDLVVGIRSIWFISNYARSLNEIYRVLAPDGIAYIRVGSSLRNLKKVYDNLEHRVKSRIYKGFVTSRDKLIEQLIQAISETNIKNFKISDEKFGVWILVKKESA